VREAPPNKRKCYSTVLLDKSPLPFPPGVVLVGSDGMVCHRLTFSLSLSLSLSSLKI